MGQILVKDPIKAGVLFDVIQQLTSSKGIGIKSTTSSGHEISVGKVKSISANNKGALFTVSFYPGKHVKPLRGKVTEGFQFVKIDGLWVLTKPYIKP